MPTPLDFHRVKAITYKKTLEGAAKNAQKELTTTYFAKEVNSLIEAIKSDYPDSAKYLPNPITLLDTEWSQSLVSGISVLECTAILNEILGVLDVIKSGH